MAVNQRVKHVRRPKKAPAEKARRQKVQKRRLVALGVAEETVAKMQPKAVRTMLRHPAKVAAKAAAKAAATA